MLHLIGVLSGGNEPCQIVKPFNIHLCFVNFLDKHCFFNPFNDLDSISSRYRCSHFHLKQHIVRTNSKKIF